MFFFFNWSQYIVALQSPVYNVLKSRSGLSQSFYAIDRYKTDVSNFMNLRIIAT